jgi:hypothetical protein
VEAITRTRKLLISILFFGAAAGLVYIQSLIDSL